MCCAVCSARKFSFFFIYLHVLKGLGHDLDFRISDDFNMPDFQMIYRTNVMFRYLTGTQDTAKFV